MAELAQCVHILAHLSLLDTVRRPPFITLASTVANRFFPQRPCSTDSLAFLTLPLLVGVAVALITFFLPAGETLYCFATILDGVSAVPLLLNAWLHGVVTLPVAVFCLASVAARSSFLLKWLPIAFSFTPDAQTWLALSFYLKLLSMALATVVMLLVVATPLYCSPLPDDEDDDGSSAPVGMSGVI
jgi:hypothetical protein